MSGVFNSSINGSVPNMTDSSGRSFPSSFSALSGAGAPMYQYTGNVQGLHNMHSNFNIPSMGGSFPSRNSGMNTVHSGGMQQPAGNLLAGRFGSNNVPDSLSQISHGISHVHSGISNRGVMNVIGSSGFSGNANIAGGSVQGVIPTSAAVGNRSLVPGLGVSSMMGNAGSRIAGPIGSMPGSGNTGRNLSSGGGLSLPGLSSRLNLTSNSGSGSLGVHQQASPQVISMLGNSYATRESSLSQNHVQAINNVSSRSMLRDMSSNDSLPFGIDDFPSLTSRPNSSGGPQGQIGPMRNQTFGGPIGQRNQEFSIQNEDFPALPGVKGGSAEFGLDLQQKDQIQDSNTSMTQSQDFLIGRSGGFTVGGTYSSLRQQQQQRYMPSVSGSNDSFVTANDQGLLQVHGSDTYPFKNPTFSVQGNGPPDNSLRTMNNLGTIPNGSSYDQWMQQYQPQNSSQFHLRQMPPTNQPVRDQTVKSSQAAQVTSDPFGLMGLLGVMRRTDIDLTSLALGIDLTTLGLNLNSSEDLYKSFGSPWSNEPAKGNPEFVVPRCYHENSAPHLQYVHFVRFKLETLFYIFYSMPKDEYQIYAANELHNRGWGYHKELGIWLKRLPNMEPLVKTQTYERGSYMFFDPNSWQKARKDDFVLRYELVETRPTLVQPLVH